MSWYRDCIESVDFEYYRHFSNILSDHKHIYFSICCVFYFFQQSHSFCCTDLLLPLLNLFLSNLLFWCYYTWDNFTSLSYVSPEYIEVQLISICWCCILQLYWQHRLFLTVFWYSHWYFLYTGSYHLHFCR